MTLQHPNFPPPGFCLIFISAGEWAPCFRLKAAHPGISNQPVTWRIENWNTLILVLLNGFSSQQDNYIDRGFSTSEIGLWLHKVCFKTLNISYIIPEKNPSQQTRTATVVLTLPIGYKFGYF